MASQVTPDAGGYCPYVQHAMELLGRRWTASVIGVLLAETGLRFGEIRCRIPGLSDRLLAERLAELEREGVVTRNDDAGHVTYRTTDKGRALGGLIAEAGRWGHQWYDGSLGRRPGRIGGCRPDVEPPAC